LSCRGDSGIRSPWSPSREPEPPAARFSLQHAGVFLLDVVGRSDRWLLQRPKRIAVLLSIFVLAYFGLWCTESFLRHYFFHSSYDLAVMDQVVWNTSQGRFFGRSLEVATDLADHLRPYLAVVSIPYVFLASPYVLLTLQSLVLALSALPLYRLALRRLQSPLLGLTIAFCWLAYPPLGFVNQYDFHVEALSIPLLIWAYERIDAGDLKTASLALVATLFCKENLGLTIAGLGITSGLLYRRWRFGLGWAFGGMAYSLTALFVVIPAFRGAASDTLERYMWLGDTPVEMLWSAVSRPDLILRELLTAGHVLTVLELMVPLGLLPLAGAPALLPAAPTLLYNFLARWSSQATIYTHYMIPVIPFVIVAAVMGLHHLGAGTRRIRVRDGVPAGSARKSRLAALGALAMVVATVGSWTFLNPVAGNAVVVPNDTAIRAGLEQVPADAGVLTTENYAPHLSHRVWIEMIPTSPVPLLPPEAETVFLNLRDLRAWRCEDYLAALSAAERSGFGLSFARDSVVLAERRRGDRTGLRDLVLHWPGCG
jgi:uncharacterized membrane protein